jgi:hypothetical protein
MRAVIILVVALFLVSGQTAGLKIVVIAGEDAVNIVQQKTAVAPIVEIRDRNDLPVSGASVTFALNGSNAAFAGGAQTLTVTTNAAGRAAVSALNPLSPGAVQINVSAAAQGQTATAVITQTNFATVAAASAAGVSVAAAAAAAGGGAGAGGGLGAAAITAIVGGAGAAAVVGARAAGVLGGSRAECTFSVSQTSLNVPSTGANVDVTVTASPDECDSRNWTASTDAPFMKVSVTSALNGSGSATVSIFVEVNSPGNPPRTGTVVIAGQTITVNQAARCRFNVSPTELTFPTGGGTLTINVTLSSPGCEQPEWTATTISNFVTLTPAAGSGNGVIAVSMGANPFSGSGPRTGIIAITGGPLVSFTQP